MNRRRFLKAGSLFVPYLFAIKGAAAPLGIDDPVMGDNPSGGNGLLIGLAGYWNMDEAAGTTRMDSSGNGLNLADNNSDLVNTVGKLGNAVVCSQGNASNALIHAANALFNTGSGISLSFSMWIYGNGIAASSRGIVCLDNNTVAGAYDLYTDGTNFIWFVFDSTHTQRTINVVSVAAQGTTSWHHFAFGYDDVNKIMWAQYDGGARTTVAVAAGMNPCTTLPFTVGNFASLGLPNSLFVDELAYYRRVLSTTDVANLYNAGAALPFSSFS